MQDAGREVLDYLAGRFTYHSRDEWIALISAGRILVNGTCCAPDTPLANGDEIEYRIEGLPEPPVADNYRVLYEDRALLAVDKPANLPCHPAGPFFNHTLWAFMKRDFEGLIPRFVSRLDRETSGVVLVARTANVQRTCQALGDAGRIAKVYSVLVEGEFPEALSAKGFLLADPASPVRKKQRFVPARECAAPPAGARECETIFAHLETRGELSLVEARLVTGRHHQIRATLCSLGYPVVGDKLYGVDDTCFLRFIEDKLTGEDRHRLRLPRQALHATRLRLPHPESGKTLDVRSPVPKAFYEVLHGALAP